MRFDCPAFELTVELGRPYVEAADARVGEESLPAL
jgi:hypothetical protein